MHTLGIDFGTTNSIICFYDDKTGRVEKFDVGENQYYIPSYLAKNRIDAHDILIGDAAREEEGLSEYDVFKYFKMLLATDDVDMLSRYGYSEGIQPSGIVEEYLQKLLEIYLEKSGTKKVKHVVITVPEIWYREQQTAEQKPEDQLTAICKNLNVKLLKMVSEPQAACAYFGEMFRQEEKRDFSGHVLVCDYGGGTLDLCLCEMDGRRDAQKRGEIKYVDSTGKGSIGDHLGAAGVAYDLAVVERLCAENGNAELRDDPKAIAELCREFEQKKIRQTDKLTRKLRSFLSNDCDEKYDSVVFEVRGMECFTSDLVEIYGEVIKPKFLQAIDEMKESMDSHQGGGRIDTQNSEVFRIVLVGGFSRFYLVQHTLEEAFGSANVSGDPRFNACFGSADIPLAIAKGAALVSGGHWFVSTSAPVSVGWEFVEKYYPPNSSVLEPKDQLNTTILLKKGTDLASCSKPTYSQYALMVDLSCKEPLRIFVEHKGDRLAVADMDNLVIQKLIPNKKVADSTGILELYFAVTMDENRQFTLHAKDENGEVKSTPLGDLVHRVSGSYVLKGGKK